MSDSWHGFAKLVQSDFPFRAQTESNSGDRIITGTVTFFLHKKYRVDFLHRGLYNTFPGLSWLADRQNAVCLRFLC